MLLLLAITGASSAPLTGAQTETVTAGGVTLQLAVDAELGLVPTAIQRSTPSGLRSIALEPSPLWRLGLVSEQTLTTPTYLEPDSSWTFQELPAPAGSVKYRWFLGARELDITIEPEPVLERIRFRASMVDHGSTDGLGVNHLDWRLDFTDDAPGGQSSIELHLGLHGGTSVFHPGMHAVDNSGAPIEGLYPGQFQPLPLSAVADLSADLVAVFAADDEGEARFEPKNFYAMKQGDSVELRVGRMIPGPYGTQPAVLDETVFGDTVITAVEITNPQAAWHDAARWYRSRVIPQLARGPIHSLTGDAYDAFDWVTQVNIGAEYDPLNQVPVGKGFTGMTQYLQGFLSSAGMNDPAEISSIVFNWANGSPPPDYLSVCPDDDFKTEYDSATGMGFRVAPYTLVATFDKDSQSLCCDATCACWIILKEDGTPAFVIDPIAGQAPKARFMDYAIPALRQHLLQPGFLFEPLANKYGINLTYLDAFPTFLPCFDPNHAAIHPLGGGASHATGAREFVRDLGGLGLDRVTSEYYHELLAGFALPTGEVPMQVGGTAYSFMNLDRLSPTHAAYIPLFVAVYGDYVACLQTGMLDVPSLINVLFPIGPALLGYDSMTPGLVGILPDPQDIIDRMAQRLAWGYVTGQRLIWTRRGTADTGADLPLPGGGKLPVANFPDTILDCGPPVDPQIDCAPWERLAKLHGAVIDLQRHDELRPFLLEGEMLTPPEIPGLVDVATGMTMPDLEPRRNGSLSPFLAGAFRHPEDEAFVLLFANWTGAQVTADFLIDGSWPGYPADLSGWTLDIYVTSPELEGVHGPAAFPPSYSLAAPLASYELAALVYRAP